MPLRVMLWPDTERRLKIYYGIDTIEELEDILGVDSGYHTVDRTMPEGWRPSWDYVDFCDSTGYYHPEYEYAEFEEWGVERRPGAYHGNSAIRQYIFTRHPWQHATTPKEIEALPLPDLDISRFAEVAKEVRDEKESHLIIGSARYLWMRGVILRGMLTYLEDLYTRPSLVEAMMDKLHAYTCQMVDTYMDLGCDGIQIAEDLGTNHGPFFSPEIFRKYFKPRYADLADRVKKRGGFFFFHGCGNLTPLVGDLVDVGVDLMHPLQPACMDQLEIKKLYGDKITIATGVSSQQTLPFGTVEDVRREAMFKLKHLAPGGGLVFGNSHFAMYEVPIKNVIALYEVCREYGKYPIDIPDIE
ncbi:MAG: uroporphyrinogen decarboxylase family protein [Anaerolineae bacterium]